VPSFEYITNKGRLILIDHSDKYILELYHINTTKPKNSHTRYVVCTEIGSGKYVGLLHRLILNISDNRIVDHINGNGLDCQKSNLRVCTFITNQHNRRLTKTQNKVKGIFYRKDRGYFTAKIVVNKKQIVLGSFMRKEDAIAARLETEAKYFKEFNGYGTQQIS